MRLGIRIVVPLAFLAACAACERLVSFETPAAPPAEPRRGVLALDVIDSTIKEDRWGVLSCVNESGDGKIIVLFTIAEDGSVTRARVESGSLRDSAIEECVVQKFRAIRFPSPEGGSLDVKYPITIRPKLAPTPSPRPTSKPRSPGYASARAACAAAPSRISMSDLMDTLTINPVGLNGKFIDTGMLRVAQTTKDGLLVTVLGMRDGTALFIAIADPKLKSIDLPDGQYVGVLGRFNGTHRYSNALGVRVGMPRVDAMWIEALPEGPVPEDAICE